jgi:hypothetical protein
VRSHNRTTTSADGLSDSTNSRIRTPPHTSTGCRSASVVKERTSSRASSAVLSRGPALRASTRLPTEGVGPIGS